MRSEAVSAQAVHWREKALAAEAARNLPGAIECWQQALSEEPDALDIVAHIAGLAARLSQWPLAERLYAHLIRNGPLSPAIIKAYAETLREQSRFDEAVDLLKAFIEQSPTEAGLWEALGTVLMAKGDTDTALIFLDEAVRLAPDALTARFERGCARFERGDVAEALPDIDHCRTRFSHPVDLYSAAIVRAYGQLAQGQLADGWQSYQARHKRGTQQEIRYDIDLQRLSGSIANKKLFLCAEQGLGDEVLFASLLPDIAAQAQAVGIAVEPRLVPLFQRSFPELTVLAHSTRTEDGRITRSVPSLRAEAWDCWAVLGDLLPDLRADRSAFSPRPYLRPDADRVRNWQDWLKSLGEAPKVGVVWKSLKFNAQRDRGYAPFSHYAALMADSQALFVNLQYGDSAAEQTQARDSGLSFVTPPEIDLKEDLDDVAALCRALDLIVAPANATSMIAAACGTEVWMVTTPVYWPALGQDNLPWFARTRLFATETMTDWSGAFARLGAALKARLEGGR